MIDPCRLGEEVPVGLKEPPIVAKVVNAYLEAMFDQLLPQFRRNSILAFGDEIEGRPKAEVLLNVHELLAAAESELPFNIVRQD
jgi:hypothetical protein